MLPRNSRWQVRRLIYFPQTLSGTSSFPFLNPCRKPMSVIELIGIFRFPHRRSITPPIMSLFPSPRYTDGHSLCQSQFPPLSFLKGLPLQTNSKQNFVWYLPTVLMVPMPTRPFFLVSLLRISNPNSIPLFPFASHTLIEGLLRIFLTFHCRHVIGIPSDLESGVVFLLCPRFYKRNSVCVYFPCNNFSSTRESLT